MGAWALQPTRMWLRLLALGIVALGMGCLAARASADGDPASDYLVGNQVFLDSQASSLPRPERELVATVAAANRAGFQIRVAVVASKYDLGGVTALWGKPQIYARFLGLELASTYKQRLLVVMPAGFGFNWPGHPIQSAGAVLGRVPAGHDPGALAGSAQTAVRKLAGAAGVTLPVTSFVRHAPARASAGSGVSGAAVAAISVAAVVVLALLFALWRHGMPAVLRHRWAIPGGLVVAALAVAIVTLNGRRSAGGHDVSPASVATPPPFSWPAGRRMAPDFVLRDQQGHPVSLAAYRGRPVIVTFVDPLCRNLCPLEAKLLNQVVGEMPSDRRPVILAVSVDVYANARANLLQDVHKWELVPEWHWAVGPAARLSAVWKRYSVGVSVRTRRIAGTTIRYILHTEAAYVIDATGHERALFVWPFYPQDVERTLRELT